MAGARGDGVEHYNDRGIAAMEELKACPYCHGDMVQGYIQSPRIIIWSKRKHRLSFLPKEYEGDIMVKGANLLGAYKQAYCCQRCETIIIRGKTGS